ncbi:phage tail fiber protein [Deinococcus kurensis]|uniref:phage tail fiber protein n=1 Tax=Deinococcus kurensis TaxID=2662757 RepID=UPI0012D2B8E2|nr:hypothetical protein [Deinococcus kurensis]
MSALSDYAERLLLNVLLREQPVWVALYVSDPTDAGGGLEAGGADPDYARVPVTFSEPLDGVCSNVDAVSFPVASAPWGTVTHLGVMDAAAGGNLLVHGPLPAPKAVEGSDQLVVGPGSLTFRLA